MPQTSAKQVSDRDRLIVRPEEPLPWTEDPEKPKTEAIDPKPANPKGEVNDPRYLGDGYTA